MSNLQISQTESFQNELLRLSKDVTAKDRERAVTHFNVSRATVSVYLNGTVRDNDTAAALILFFKSCITKRNLVLLDTQLSQTANHG